MKKKIKMNNFEVIHSLSRLWKINSVKAEAVEALLSRLLFQKLFSYDKQKHIILCDDHLNLLQASVCLP